MKKAQWQMALRIVLTVAAWVLIILYFHKLGHQYLGDIKSYLDASAARLVMQIFLVVGLVYLVLLSLPGVAAPGHRGIITIVIWAALLAVGHQVSHTGLHEIQAILLMESAVLNWFSITLVSILIYAYSFPSICPRHRIGCINNGDFWSTGRDCRLCGNRRWSFHCIYGGTIFSVIYTQ